jgi:hypothetical protein
LDEDPPPPADGSAGEGTALVDMESSKALDEEDPPPAEGSVGEGTTLVDPHTHTEEVIREREREREREKEKERREDTFQEILRWYLCILSFRLFLTVTLPTTVLDKRGVIMYSGRLLLILRNIRLGNISRRRHGLPHMAR